MLRDLFRRSRLVGLVSPPVAPFKDVNASIDAGTAVFCGVRLLGAVSTDPSGTAVRMMHSFPAVFNAHPSFDRQIFFTKSDQGKYQWFYYTRGDQDNPVVTPLSVRVFRSSNK